MERELPRMKERIGVALSLHEAGLLPEGAYERLRRAYKAIERWEETGIIEDLRGILDAYAEAESILLMFDILSETEDEPEP